MKISTSIRCPDVGGSISFLAVIDTAIFSLSILRGQNHLMLGYGEKWFYRGLAGFTVDISRLSDTITVESPPLSGAKFVSGSYSCGVSKRRSKHLWPEDGTIIVERQLVHKSSFSER
jgi:hypothetical protein